MAYYQGKLYIGGGSPVQGFFLRDFYVYDIQTNTWTRLADHPNFNGEGWAVAYNGKIYVTGERVPLNPGNFECTDQFYYYNIASNSWSPMPVFPGGLRSSLRLAELNGVLYGGFGRQCLGGQPNPREWWAFCP
jgi:N-acetylneuraminic acid mutarotase